MSPRLLTEMRIRASERFGPARSKNASTQNTRAVHSAGCRSVETSVIIRAHSRHLTGHVVGAGTLSELVVLSLDLGHALYELLAKVVELLEELHYSRGVAQNADRLRSP